MWSAHCVDMNDTNKVTMISAVHVCVSCALFFGTHQQFVKTAVGCHQREPAAASGQRERVGTRQRIPRLTRVRRLAEPDSYQWRRGVVAEPEIAARDECQCGVRTV